MWAGTGAIFAHAGSEDSPVAIGKLNLLKIKNAKPGRHGDGGGLWLQVRDAEHRSWLFRFTRHGKARQMGLGPFPDVTLGEAREAARKFRGLLREGIDPIDNRRHATAAAREAAQVMLFRKVADHYLTAHERAWSHPKHRQQWRASLEVAHRIIGNRPVASITTGDVMRVLEPIWHEKPESASRLRGRMESILDYAGARGWRHGDNPARWRGHLAKLLPAPGTIAKVEHYAALPWPEIGEFMAAVRDEDGVAARALELTILTATRTNEVLGARWAEIDMQAGMWTVPAERMKAKREHRIPLSSAALSVLEAMAPLQDDWSGGWVFPGAKPGKPLSNMAMAMVLRRMKRPDLTVHGFRSTFRDWCAETTNYPRKVAEQALAHTLGDKVEAAYRRGDLFEKRRRLMDEWAEFCARLVPVEQGQVVPLRPATEAVA